MNKQIVQAIIQFLLRVDLKGAEAPVLVQCLTALQELLKEPKDG